MGANKCLEVTPIKLRAQLSNMLGEKRASVPVKKKGKCRPLRKQLRQLIERYPHKLRALAGGSGSEPFVRLEKSEFAQRLTGSHRNNRRLFSFDDNVDGAHFNYENGVGTLINVVSKLTRQENCLLSDSQQSREIIGVYPAKQIRTLNHVSLIHQPLSPNFGSVLFANYITSGVAASTCSF
jgi:hypothetical protein